MKWRSKIAVVLIAAACRTAAPVEGMPRNFGIVEEGKIYRGAQPSSGEIANLQRRGIRTIVKLNSTDLEAERATASAHGIRLIEVPLDARTAGTSKSCEKVERAYAAITDPRNWPVYVHCQHGRDRTGFLVGLYRERVQSWTFEQVSEELSRYGHGAQMRLVFPNISNALANRYQACATAR